MDTVLISVTLISLGLAGAMGVLVAKLLRDERKRSDARMETLIELASEAPEPAATPPLVARAGARRIAARPAPTAAPAPATRVSRAPALDDFEIRPSGTVAVADIFAEPTRTSPWGRRLAVIGVLATLASGLFAVLTFQNGEPGVGPAPATARGVTPAAPLELVSLRHAQDGDTLTITGLVQNPKAGSPLTRITVTAVALAPDGTLLASGNAPLDYTSLAAGEESPFVITVPVRGAVARYRVGFRSEDGSVVAHVDRRAADVSRAGL
jgi:hypothetical protein